MGVRGGGGGRVSMICLCMGGLVYGWIRVGDDVWVRVFVCLFVCVCI